MKELKPKLVESFCTQDESARSKAFCKLVSGVLFTQDIQQAEELYPCFSGSDSNEDSF